MKEQIKKCPHCGAEIEEQARFCLYCMTSLDEKEVLAPKPSKKRWWIYGSAVLLALLLILGLVLLLVPPKTPPTEEKQPNSSESAPEAPPVNDEAGSSSELPDASVNNTPDTPTDQPPETPVVPGTVGGTPATGGEEKPTVDGEEEPVVDETEEPVVDEEEKPAEPPQKPVASAVVYQSRAAQYGKDDYKVTTNVDDCVVITGIVTPAADGIYRIPATIDGKEVIAICAEAFYASGCAQGVKEVYIPAGLRTLWNDAFLGCYNLEGVYLYGNSVYIDPQAFPSLEKRNKTITIHCAYDCSNRDFHYYRNIAESYFNARYEEWNG